MLVALIKSVRKKNTLISSASDLQDELREAAHPNLAKEPAPERCNDIRYFIFLIIVHILCIAPCCDFLIFFSTLDFVM